MDNHLFSLRAKDLLSMIAQEYKAHDGALLLFGGFEHSGTVFRQESSFYYVTGISEPGTVALYPLKGASTLYVPNHGDNRASWVHTPVALTQANAKKLGFDAITPLGAVAPGYQLYPFSDISCYEKLIKDLSGLVASGKKIFTLMPNNAHEYIEQRQMIARLDTVIPNFKNSCIDISGLVALMRRKKDMREIETIYKAVEITILAQGAAAQSIGQGIKECEVQASLEYMFTGSQARAAFPSIVAAGKNATILHYHQNSAELANGQLVVVDIGAEYDYYCADLTRTYPVSGAFTKRQKELYNLVLATQEHVAGLAKPGMWLNNKEKPEKSLHHLAKKFLDERGGYGKYFIHGIGHFLGIDVHDVGNGADPLQDGDVFTIEPGIYIPEEQIGIRIEDNYWMAKDGLICLSEALPKRAEDIEALMQEVEETETEADFDLPLSEDFEDSDLAEG